MNIIIKPILTEKSVVEAQQGRFTFMVAQGANKHEIKEAIQKMFNVTVTGVYTNTIKGTKTRWTRKGKQKTDETYKKARVQLAKNQKIDVFDLGKEDSK